MIRSDVSRWLRRNHVVGKVVLAGTTLAVLGVVVHAKMQHRVLKVNHDTDAWVNMATMDGSDIFEELAQVSTEAVAVDMVSTTSTSPFDGRFIANITDTLNVRAEASAEADLVGKMYPGCVGEIVGTQGEWTQITSGDVEGYVKTEYILSGADAEELADEYGKNIGTVTADVLYVRRNADASSEAIAMLVEDDEVYVTDSLDGWYQVLVNESWEGYVSADFLDVEYKFETAITIEEELARIQAAKEAERAEQEAQGGSGSSEVPVSYVDPTDVPYEDSYLLACLVSMEAGHEPYEGQLAVANVVLNRLRSGRFGGSISSVIYAPGQFPSVGGSVMQGYLQNGPLPQAQQAANEALSGVNNIGSYMYFINVKYANYASYSSYTIIGNHCFH